MGQEPCLNLDTKRLYNFVFSYRLGTPGILDPDIPLQEMNNASPHSHATPAK